MRRRSVKIHSPGTDQAKPERNHDHCRGMDGIEFAIQCGSLVVNCDGGEIGMRLVFLIPTVLSKFVFIIK